jgi:hypothetical protein
MILTKIGIYSKSKHFQKQPRYFLKHLIKSYKKNENPYATAVYYLDHLTTKKNYLISKINNINIFPGKIKNSNMIKLIFDITRNNLFNIKSPEEA